jgi:deazaflavin-dependent oxidoreductase (nitroreductase family)
MPSNFSFKVMNATHRIMLKLTGGRTGWTAMRMPVLELTTTGRKTGRPHTVMLTSPLQEGRTLVVVASRGGDDTSPAWFLNLKAHPDVEVVLQGKAKQHMHARIATPEERNRLWPLVTANHTNYADYQKRTDREIALVLLDPTTC